MHKPTLCTLLNILMVAGVALFLFPYVTGKVSAGLLFLVVGGLITVLCSVGRCVLSESHRRDQHALPRIP